MPCALLLSGVLRAHAQARDGEALSILLVTIGPGQEPFSWLGHTAVVVRDSRMNRELLFDYGVVVPSPATSRSILHGTLVAYPALRDARPTLARWKGQGRSVTLQELALPPTARANLQQLLLADLSPAPRGYRYDIRTNNCTSRIRDMLDRVTDGALRRAGSSSTGLSLREIGYRQIEPAWVITASDLLVNHQFDGPATQWDAAIFPSDLATLVAITNFDSAGLQRPLVWRGPSASATAITGYRPSGSDLASFGVTGAALAVITLAAGLAARRGRVRSRVALGLWLAGAGGMLGLLGATIMAEWAFTSYPFAPYNANLLLANPLLLGALPLGLRYAAGSPRARQLLAQLFSGCLGLALVMLLARATTHTVDQNNTRTILLTMPLLAAMPLALHLARAPARRHLSGTKAYGHTSITRQPSVPADSRGVKHPEPSGATRHV